MTLLHISFINNHPFKGVLNSYNIKCQWCKAEGIRNNDIALINHIFVLTYMCVLQHFGTEVYYGSTLSMVVILYANHYSAFTYCTKTTTIYATAAL